MSDLTLLARLGLDNRGYLQGLNGAKGQTRSFAGVVRSEISALGNFLGSTQAKLAGYGAGFALGAQIVKSAQLDKTLTQIGLTAGASRQEIAGLRGELFGMAAETGRNVDDLQEGVATLVASGLALKESLATLPAINRTMAVTNATADTLAGTLGVASTAFHFDLSKPQTATLLLDQMTQAGRRGNAELENLGSIFSRVGVNAGRAGLGFEQTLAFIEGLSLIERQPERLATLADSTLRLFTNARYMAEAQKASGIRFFDKATGDRRDPLVVLAEFKKKFDSLRTDAQREGFLAKAFGQADQDTIKGVATLLQGDTLAKVHDFTGNIKSAGGTIDRDLQTAIGNAADQTGRLKARLRDAADAFAQPINAVYSKLLNKALGDGGKTSGLSNAELIGGGVGVLAGGYVLKRLLGGIAGRLLGGAGSLAGGVAMGTALEQAGAATPVFIVGAAPGLFSGAGGGLGVAGNIAAGGAAAQVAKVGIVRAALAGAPVSALLGAGAAGVATVGAGVTAAGAGGYAAGKGLYALTNMTAGGRRKNEQDGETWARVLAFFGNDTAQEALANTARGNAALAHRTTRLGRGGLFANVQGRVDGRAVSADDIGSAVSKAIANDWQRRPLKGELDVRITDQRATVVSRGGDFVNVRSSTRTVRGNTGRAMGDRA